MVLAVNVRSTLVRLPDRLLADGLRLRTEVPQDQPFLLRLYRSTREHELEMLPDWTDAMKDQFIAQQFAAQSQHYRATIAGCSFDVIEHNGVPVGRLYIQERQTNVHIVDIALIPEVRGKGWGGAIIESLIASADAVGKGVDIFVESFNPARRLYERLGFVPIGEQSVYLEMERPASNAG